MQAMARQLPTHAEKISRPWRGAGTARRPPFSAKVLSLHHPKALMISVRDTIPTGRIPASTTGIRLIRRVRKSSSMSPRGRRLPDRDALPRHDRADGASRSAPLTHPCRISVCIRCMTVTVSPPPTNRTTSLSRRPGKAPVRVHGGRAGNAVIVEEDDRSRTDCSR